MSERIRNKITGFIAVTILVCLTNTVRAQEQPPVLKSFLAHCATLLKHGGKWRAENKSYDPTGNGSSRYFGYEYQKGLNDQTVRLKITGYVPGKSQWMVFWDGYYTWDARKRKVIYSSVSAEGVLATGEITDIGTTAMTLVFTLTRPDGSTEMHKDIQRIQGDSIISESYVLQGKKWNPNRNLTWVKLEQPKGVLAFMSTRDGNFEVYTMKATGDSLVNLTCNKTSDYTFSFAPGRRMVFSSNREGNEEVYIMEADGKKVINLTNHPAHDRVASASPDGSRIVFNSYRDSKEPELYLMNADGSDLKRLTNNDKYEDAASWSPNGKQIIFGRETGEGEVSNGEIFIMDADGNNERKLTNRPGFDAGPKFSPDGRKIAFYGKSDQSNYEIFVMDADGSNIINLTDDEAEDYSPSWSPDGQWIAYTRGNASNYDVWVIHIATRIKYRLTTQPKRDESPVWISVN